MNLNIYIYISLSIIQVCYSIEKICDENCALLTDFGPSNCNWKNHDYYDLDSDDYPICNKKGGDGDFCGRLPCAPGFKCNDNTFKCEAIGVSCTYFEQLPVDKRPKWIPKCLPDGTYAPKQCKGELKNGRCYCSDAYGKRIFGEEWSRNADNMTCACSRRRAELEVFRDNVTLHCDSSGNYEPLQCDSGSCWCANTRTGEVLDSVVPENMMTILPCYKHEEIGDQYLRQCESQTLANAKITEELLLHGTHHPNLPIILCDWDGSYGRYKIDNGNTYCTWRDNSNLGSWSQSVDEDLSKLNCNCARDTNIYKLAGLKMTKQCEGNGNYKEIQKSEDMYYCVDEDGYATIDPVDVRPVCPKF